MVFNFWIRHTQSTFAFTVVATLFVKRMMLLAKPEPAVTAGRRESGRSALCHRTYI